MILRGSEERHRVTRLLARGSGVAVGLATAGLGSRLAEVGERLLKVRLTRHLDDDLRFGDVLAFGLPHGASFPFVAVWLYQRGGEGLPRLCLHNRESHP